MRRDWLGRAPSSSFTLPAPSKGRGEAGPSRPVQQVFLPPPYTASAFCTSSKARDSKVRWSFYTLSHKEQGMEKKGENGHPLILALPTMVLENMVPDLTVLGSVQKSN